MKKGLKKLLLAFGLVFLLVNVVVFYQTWHIIHFCKPATQAFVSPDKMTTGQKVNAMLLGMYNPKLPDDSLPRWFYKSVKLPLCNGGNLDAWDIPAAANKGTVLIMHGFRGNKSNMLPIAEYFLAQGMNCFLLDFSGHGNSDGYSSSVGYYEGKEVELAYQYIKAHHTGPVIFFGSSMGAVAALHAVSNNNVHPDKMILEAPFGSMLQAVRNRFDMQGVPSFPIAQMSVLWGSVQQGFWAFNNRPVDYAKAVKIPVLLLYGLNDKKVTMKETQAIFANLQGEKTLHLFAHSGHCNFFKDEPAEWMSTIGNFLYGPAIVQGE